MEMKNENQLTDIVKPALAHMAKKINKYIIYNKYIYIVHFCKFLSIYFFLKNYIHILVSPVPNLFIFFG